MVTWTLCRRPFSRQGTASSPQLIGRRADCCRLVARRCPPPERGVLCLRVPGAAGFADATLFPAAARWDESLGEFILDWDDVRTAKTAAAAVEFAHSAFRQACLVCPAEHRRSGGSRSPAPVRPGFCQRDSVPVRRARCPPCRSRPDCLAGPAGQQQLERCRRRLNVAAPSRACGWQLVCSLREKQATLHRDLPEGQRLDVFG